MSPRSREGSPSPSSETPSAHLWVQALALRGLVAGVVGVVVGIVVVAGGEMEVVDTQGCNAAAVTAPVGSGGDC